MSEKFILVAGDVHSDECSFEILSEIAENSDCLAFLYTGDLDIENYFISIKLRNRNFVFLPVLGNCDSSYAFISADVPLPPSFRTCKYFGMRIFITHGHLYRMPNDAGLSNNDFDIVINGHTHIPSKSKENNLLVINPGSASKPRGFSRKSYIKIFSNKQIVFENII